MSARLAGIGLLGALGLVAGAGAAYLAVKSESPAAAVAAQPGGSGVEGSGAEAPRPNAGVQAASQSATSTVELPQAATAVEREAPRPVVKPAVSSTAPVTDPPVPAVSATRPAAEEPPATPSPSPVAAPPAAAEPPAAASVQASAEPPRYTPDPPAPASTPTQETRRIDFDELTVAKHSVIGIRLDAPISTRTARVEDRVSATVSRDVTVAGRTAIAAGVRLEGTVVLVERGGRFKTRPRLGLKFDRLILSDGTRVSLKTDTIYREGDSPTADAAARVGTGAVAGAILGAMIGGKKGAAIGGAAGAAGGVATVMRGDEGEATLPGGAPLTVRLTEDVAILINR